MIHKSTSISHMGAKKQDYMMAWVSLVHAGTYLTGALNQHFQDELGISMPEQDLLKQLGVAGGELKLVDLSRRIYLSKAGVTKMMDRLESAGLVVRERSTLDRRVINARLTASGKNTLERSWKLLAAWVKSNFSDHLDEKQIHSMRDALESILRGHDRWEGQLAHLRGKATAK